MIKYFTLDNEKLRNTGKETDQTIWYCVERLIKKRFIS